MKTWRVRVTDTGASALITREDITVYAGDEITIQRKLSIPVGRVAASALLSIKRSEKATTSLLDLHGVIAGGVVTFTIAESAYAVLRPLGYLFGSVTLDGAETITCAAGRLRVRPSATAIATAQTPVHDITVTPPLITDYGIQLPATAVQHDAVGGTIASPSPTWSTTATPDVASIDPVTGVLTILTDGTFKIAATSFDGRYGETTIAIGFSTTPASVTATPTPISVTNSGGSVLITPEVRNAAGVILPGAPVVYQVLDATLAHVDGTGTLFGDLPGVSVLRVIAGGAHVDIPLTVLDASDAQVMVPTLHGLTPFRMKRLHFYDHALNGPIYADALSPTGFRQDWRVNAFNPGAVAERLIPDAAYLGAGVGVPVSADGKISRKGWKTPHAVGVTTADHDEGNPAEVLYPGTVLASNTYSDHTAGMTIGCIGHLPTGANLWSTTDGHMDAGDDLKNALALALNGSSFALSEAGPNPSWAHLSLFDRFNNNLNAAEANRRLLVATGGRDCRGVTFKNAATTTVGGVRDIIWSDSTGSTGNFNDASIAIHYVGQGALTAPGLKFFLDYLEVKYPLLNIWNDTRRFYAFYGDSYDAPRSQQLPALWQAGVAAGSFGGATPLPNVGAYNMSRAGHDPSHSQFPFSRLHLETSDHSKRPAGGVVYSIGEWRNLNPVDTHTHGELDAFIKVQFDWCDLLRTLTPATNAGKIKLVLRMWQAGAGDSLPGGAAATYVTPLMNAGWAAHADGFVNLNIVTPFYTNYFFGSGIDGTPPIPHDWGSTHPGGILQVMAFAMDRAAFRKGAGEYSVNDNVWLNFVTDNVNLTPGAPTANPAIVDGRNAEGGVVSQVGKTYKHYLAHYIPGGDVREDTSGTYLTIVRATGVVTRVAPTAPAGSQFWRVTICDQDNGIGLVEFTAT